MPLYFLAFIVSVFSFQTSAQISLSNYSNYMGIELMKSTEAQLFSTFTPMEKTDILTEVDDVGYCFFSINGIYVAFTIGPDKTVRTVEISNRALAVNCKEINVKFPTCLENICLGQTRDHAQNAIGKTFTPVDYPPNSDLEAIFFEYFLPLNEQEVDKETDTAAVLIRHNIWSKFDARDVLYYLGALKEKDLS